MQNGDRHTTVVSWQCRFVGCTVAEALLLAIVLSQAGYIICWKSDLQAGKNHVVVQEKHERTPASETAPTPSPLVQQRAISKSMASVLNTAVEEIAYDIDRSIMRNWIGISCEAELISAEFAGNDSGVARIHLFYGEGYRGLKGRREIGFVDVSSSPRGCGIRSRIVKSTTGAWCVAVNIDTHTSPRIPSEDDIFHALNDLQKYEVTSSVD